MDRYSLLITCEHAGNELPAVYEKYFVNADDVLDAHRGWDPGAWLLAESLGKYFNVKPIPFFTTRLLIEPNRSLDHSELFSEFSKDFTVEQKEILVKDLYVPYREQVFSVIHHLEKPVLHLSIHTFTPVFKGAVRNVDIGLLFDPQRSNETMFCEKWKRQLAQFFPEWRIAYNEPYLGIDDGFTTSLRTQFPDKDYLGIEVEWNQKWAATSHAPQFYDGIIKSLAFVDQAF